MSENPLTEQQIDEREQEARELVEKKAMYSSIAAAVPIPLLDIGTDMKLMKDITGDIEEIFELDHKQVNELSDDLRNRALVMATSMGSEFVGRRTTNFMLKRVTKNSKKSGFGIAPIAGQAVGAFISYKVMKKLGNAHVDKCVSAAKQTTVA